MDEILNRPLFRHKAQIAYKRVQGLQIGGPPQSPFTPGGFGQSMQRLGQAYQASPLVDLIYDPRQSVGRNVINVFNPVRKARGIYGLGKMGVGYGMKGLEKAERGYEKLASKSPTKFGAATQVAGLGLGAGGVEDVIEGVKTDDLSRTASGAGDILLGIPLAKSGGARFRTGKPTNQTLSEGLPALGFYGASMVLPENELKRTQDLQIQQYENQTGVKFNANQRKEAELIIAKQYEAQKQGQQPQTALDKAFGNISNVDIIAGVRPVDSLSAFSNTANNIVQQSNDAKNIPPKGIDEDELKFTLKNDEQKAKAGEKLKTLAEKNISEGSKDAAEFKKFYAKMDELTGGSREISDLLMYKLAAGLLTGTTTKTGFAGFADVLGKTGGDVLDTAIVLASKEKDRKADLAAAFLKAKKADGNTAITVDRFTTIIPDPNAFNGVRVEERAKFKDTGLDAKAVESNEIDPTTGIRLPAWIEAEYNPNAIETKKDPKLLDERRAALNSVAGSYRMASIIAKADEGTIGAPGSIKLFKEKLIGSTSSIFANELAGNYNGNIDEYVNKDILGKGVRRADGTFISAEDAIKEKERLISEAVRKQSKIFQRPTPSELTKLTENARFETNFAYAYANSLKAEDRLTEKNLEDAKKVSRIFGLESPRKIKEQFRQLADDADAKFGEETKRYQALGGNSAFFDQNFSYMPYYIKEKNRVGGAQKRQEIQQNLMRGVETLPDKYK